MIDHHQMIDAEQKSKPQRGILRMLMVFIGSMSFGWFFHCLDNRCNVISAYSAM